MKRILAILLVCVFAFACVACDNSGGDESSNSGFGATSTNSTVTTSKEESSEPADETSEEVSVDPKDEITFTNKFMSWNNAYYKGGLVSQKAEATTSLQFSKVNEAVADYDIGVFTSDYGATIESEGQDYANFAVAVFTYDHTKFGYTMTSFSEVGAADAATAIPEDGWVVAIHSEYADKIAAIQTPTDDVKKFPYGAVYFLHGIKVYDGLDTTIVKTETAPTLDGKVGATEYGTVVWDIEPENIGISYAQFDAGNYYASAKVYMTYDAEKLYVAVVVTSPYHFNDKTEATKGEMWACECIQVNIASETCDSEYISQNWNHAGGSTAASDNVFRQYGFCVNDEGETLSTVWMGKNGSSSTAEASCARDDAAQTTVYEFAIPWAECGAEDAIMTGEEGVQFGLGLSVNSGDGAVDEDGNPDSEFKNITLRDGGGVIGINDFSKHVTITLG